ncbi:hypothetical protein EMIHUDRAFT_242759, partial [Emiliania huxleyi CCMP1516]
MSELLAAAKAGDVASIKRLVQGGANVNEQNPTVGATALVYAAQAGRTEAVQALIELRANPGLTTRKGKTALVVAQEKGHAAVVSLLQQAAAAPAVFGAPPAAAP